MPERSAIRLLDAALSGDEAARAAVARRPALKNELTVLEQVRSVLQASAMSHVTDPWLAGHVVRRLTSRAHHEQALYGSLLNIFRPVVIAALLIMASLLTYNTTLRGSYSVVPTTTEVMLGLQPVTLTAAYSADLEPLFPADP